MRWLDTVPGQTVPASALQSRVRWPSQRALLRRVRLLAPALRRSDCAVLQPRIVLVRLPAVPVRRSGASVVLAVLLERLACLARYQRSCRRFGSCRILICISQRTPKKKKNFFSKKKKKKKKKKS